jgi:hypothetical protein
MKARLARLEKEGRIFEQSRLAFLMKIPIELTGESRDLLVRHFKERTELHDILEHASRNEVAGVAVYAFECEPQQAEELFEMARNHCPPAVKDIEHAIFAATAGMICPFTYARLRLRSIQSVLRHYGPMAQDFCFAFSGKRIRRN